MMLSSTNRLYPKFNFLTTWNRVLKQYYSNNKSGSPSHNWLVVQLFCVDVQFNNEANKHVSRKVFQRLVGLDLAPCQCPQFLNNHSRFFPVELFSSAFKLNWKFIIEADRRFLLNEFNLSEIFSNTKNIILYLFKSNVTHLSYAAFFFSVKFLNHVVENAWQRRRASFFIVSSWIHVS